MRTLLVYRKSERSHGGFFFEEVSKMPNFDINKRKRNGNKPVELTPLSWTDIINHSRLCSRMGTSDIELVEFRYRYCETFGRND